MGSRKGRKENNFTVGPCSLPIHLYWISPISPADPLSTPFASAESGHWMEWTTWMGPTLPALERSGGGSIEFLLFLQILACGVTTYRPPFPDWGSRDSGRHQSCTPLFTTPWQYLDMESSLHSSNYSVWVSHPFLPGILTDKNIIFVGPYKLSLFWSLPN